MRIGLLSDTHDNVATAAAAIALLQQQGAQLLLHCGDVGSQRILDLLAGLPAAFVWGNCDWDRRGLERYAANIKLQCYGAVGDLAAGGKRIALLHGDDHRLRRQILAAQEYDYLFQGHTHVRADERMGRTHIVNPGALHRAAEKTVALVDTAADSVRFLVVE